MPFHNAVPDPAQLDRELKVLELRRAGLTWQRIAEEVGYADHSGAYMAYKRAMKRVLQQPAEELRNAELDRLDRLQLAIWQKAMRGETNAIGTVLRIMERRARLLGLDAPQKIQAEVMNYDAGSGSLDAEVERFARIIDAELIGESQPVGDPESEGVDSGEPPSLEAPPSEEGTTPAGE